MFDHRKVLTIGVAGGTASGKSTISRAIVEEIGAQNITHLLHDGYYRSWYHLAGEGQTRHDVNFDHPDSLETELLIRHIRHLQKWEPIEQPVYDFVRDERSDDTVTVEPQPVLLVEGILVLGVRELRELFDLKVYVDTPADIRFIRRLKRDISERGRSVESVIEQYESTVRPMHEAFVEPSKRHADIIVPHGGYNEPAISMIADRLRWILHARREAMAQLSE